MSFQALPELGAPAQLLSHFPSPNSVPTSPPPQPPPTCSQHTPSIFMSLCPPLHPLSHPPGPLLLPSPSSWSPPPRAWSFTSLFSGIPRPLLGSLPFPVLCLSVSWFGYKGPPPPPPPLPSSRAVSLTQIWPTSRFPGPGKR